MFIVAIIATERIFMKPADAKYKLKDGVYYMVTDDGQEMPVDIDAPPAFKANLHSEIVIASVLKEFLLPKGKTVKIDGIPFQLKNETKILGTEKNYKLI
jgi:hypothetical protein